MILADVIPHPRSRRFNKMKLTDSRLLFSDLLAIELVSIAERKHREVSGSRAGDCLPKQGRRSIVKVQVVLCLHSRDVMADVRKGSCRSRVRLMDVGF